MDKTTNGQDKRKPKFPCTSCGKYITTLREAKRHPALNTLQCVTCNNTYVNVGDLSKYRGGLDQAGHDNYCRWCLDGGDIVVCCDDSCRFCFCEVCIERNFGKKTLNQIRELQNWYCFICDHKQLEKLQQEADKTFKSLKPNIHILTEVPSKTQLPPMINSTQTPAVQERKLNIPIKAGCLGLFSTSKILIQPKPKPIPQPTLTSQPTSSPQPTLTSQPTSLPQPTLTSQPTSSPQPTLTSQPTSLPQPTLTSQPTSSPQPTLISQPTSLPQPTLTSQPTSSPQPKTTITENINLLSVPEENTLLSLEQELFLSDDDSSAEGYLPAVDTLTNDSIPMEIDDNIPDVIIWANKDAVTLRKRIAVLKDALAEALEDFDELKFKNNPTIMTDWVRNIEAYMKGAPLIAKRCQNFYAFTKNDTN